MKTRASMQRRRYAAPPSCGVPARCGSLLAMGAALLAPAPAAAQSEGGPSPLDGPRVAAPAADEGVRERQGAPEAELPSWSARIGIGFMVSASSELEQVVVLDGYGAPLRTGVTLAGDLFLTDVVGVGAWGGTWWRSSRPEYGGPTFRDTSRMVGLEVPLRTRGRVAEAFLAPRLGLAWNEARFDGRVPASTALAYGLEGVVWFTRAHVGLTLGWMRAVAETRGQIPLRNDSGGLYFQVNGVIDG